MEQKKSETGSKIDESRVNEADEANDQPEEEMTLLEQFKQQMMKAWQPVPTLSKTIIMFFILSAIFLGIGIVMIILSKNLSQSSFRYDNDSNCAIGSTCSVTF